MAKERESDTNEGKIRMINFKRKIQIYQFEEKSDTELIEVVAN